MASSSDEQATIDAMAAVSLANASAPAPLEHMTSEEVRSEFNECQLRLSELDSWPGRGDDKELMQKLRDILAKVDACSLAARRMQLISENELLEDINTEDLPLVLLDFVRGRVYLKLMDVRLERVKMGNASLESFLHHSLKVGALDAALPGTSLTDLLSDKPPKREDKIERYKRGRELEQQIKNTTLLVRQGERTGMVDEDVLREQTMLMIQTAVLKAADDLSASIRELQLLERMAAFKAASGESASSSSAGGARAEDPRERQRMEMEEQARSKGLEVTHLYPDMSSERETIKAQVFRPSWRQPTVSLEEYADMEMAQLKEREERQKDAPQRDQKYHQLLEEGLEDDTELVDKATVRDRDWDNWKDDHPKGAGVTNRF